MIRVAFQGEFGAFSEEAVQQLFRGDAAPYPCREFRDVGAAVAAGDAEFGLLPIENSLAGSVIPTYDVLASSDLQVRAEIVIPIHHCLLAVPGADLDGLARVLSHPVALAQCTRFFHAHPSLAATAVYDTAGAARQVALDGDTSIAAIAGRRAAERYGLDVLRASIEDSPDNQTRFVLLARADQAAEAPSHARSAGPRSLLMLETPNEPGALVRVLVPFAEHGINLSKIESRPGEKPWTYRFFLEVDADCTSESVRPVIDALSTSVRAKILGCYPRWAPPA
jgi:prephenate dehydratase